MELTRRGMEMESTVVVGALHDSAGIEVPG
jgi:hypothetical protein